MKRNVFLLSLLIILLIPGFSVHAKVLYGAKAAVQSSDPTLQQMLTYAIQDEYLSHAEYTYIIQKYGATRPFSNIISAEENHINMLKPLFKKYGFELPGNNAVEHIVVSKDLKEAVETGVQAEIDNIGMYEKFLTKPLPEDVRDVFEKLKAASENHLRALGNALKRFGN